METPHIRPLFAHSEAQHEALKSLIGTKEKSVLHLLGERLENHAEGILPWDLEGQEKPILNFFCLVCIQAHFASEEEEPFLIAGFLCQGLKESYPLPELTEDQGIRFCSKTLTALSIYPQAMEKRCHRYGAPSAETYRKTSQGILKVHRRQGYQALSAHHKAWENYIGEKLLIHCEGRN